LTSDGGSNTADAESNVTYSDPVFTITSVATDASTNGGTGQLRVFNTNANSGNAGIWLGNSGARKAAIIAEKQSSGNNHDLVFFTNASTADATERIRILDTGFVAINKGGSDPSYALDVTDDIRATDDGFINDDFNAGGGLFFVDDSSSHVGVGTTLPGARFEVKQDGASAGNGLRIADYNSSDYWELVNDSLDNLDFIENGTTRGYLSSGITVNNIDFTGQHRSLVSTINDNTEGIAKSELVGLIVIADGTYTNLSGGSKALINEALPNVKLSDTAFDRRAFGVISDKEDLENGLRTYEQGLFVTVYPTSGSEQDRLIINSVGEGGMWVCDYSGSLSNGEYITTSPIKGLGMRQESSILHNYTVAKITQDCNFNISGSYTEFEWSGSMYRKEFVGVTYHCG
jgi:hypothetical protein